MNNLQLKIKRQIEIIGVSICPGKTVHHSIPELADMFGVDEVTIKRDLKDLRFMGVPVSSYKGRGVMIRSGLNDEMTREFLLQYVGLCYSKNIFDKSTSLLIEKHKYDAVGNFVQLQICIEKTTSATIEYHNHDYEYERRVIKPLLIFHSEGSWRLLTQDGNSVKQFHLDKITKVWMGNSKFERISDKKLEEYFCYSWGSWIGKEKIKVKLQFDKTWAERLKFRTLIKDQSFEVQEDDSVIYSVTVNTLNEITSWIVSRGKGCKVLEPIELRERVIQIAKETLGNYD
jgi:predicted DNA-binding transcriptional regulator YafY